MNNLVKYACALVMGAMMSSQAWSLSITDVGGVDTFLTSTYLANSGDATEEAWVESILGIDVSLDAKYDSDGPDWTLADGEFDVYYREMETNPDYFMLKIGIGGTSLTDTHYLFQNFGDLSFAVVDFSVAGIDFTIQNIDINRMSHVDEFDGSIVVSEPATLALLGIGLIGLGAARRKISA